MTERPIRVQLRRTKGWRMPPNTVKVDRTTKWGNPFVPGKHIWFGLLQGRVVEDNRHAFVLYRSFAPVNDKLVAMARAELRGKNLACWCGQSDPYEDACHAAVLLEIANSNSPTPLSINPEPIPLSWHPPMPLAHRIIPTILCRGHELVKGVAFSNARRVGVAAQAVRVHALRGVDEVLLLDITATKERRPPDLQLVADLSEVMFAPLTVGGGVSTVEHVRALLRAGADKVVIGTAAGECDVVSEAASIVGSQAIAVSVDVVGGASGRVMLRSATADIWANPVLYAVRMAQSGAGEILLQSVERDGTLAGYDLELIRAVQAAVDIPVIASGGCGTYEHMLQAIDAGASAVAAGAMFQFTDSTPRGAAQFLAARGVEVRL